MCSGKRKKKSQKFHRTSQDIISGGGKLIRQLIVSHKNKDRHQNHQLTQDQIPKAHHQTLLGQILLTITQLEQVTEHITQALTHQVTQQQEDILQQEDTRSQVICMQT